MNQREIPLVHPGKILLEDWLIPLSISQYTLSEAINVPQHLISKIVRGKCAITPDIALRLAAFFGTDEQSWLNLQSYYDAEIVREKIADTLTNIQPFPFSFA